MADSRFAALNTDPRYRIPNRRQARTAVDPRFKSLFTDQEFRRKARVDRYGRKIQAKTEQSDLERFYKLDQGDDEREKEGAAKITQRRSAHNELDIEDATDEDEDQIDYDSDRPTLRERGVANRTKDPARDGGFAGSSSEEESSEEEDDSEAELADETAGHEQTEEIPLGEVSRRIAAVNLDWDNIRAADILAVASSFAPPKGRISNVTIYPSEFGRERLQREEIEGPPREIFGGSKNKTSSSAENDLIEAQDLSEETDSDEDVEDGKENVSEIEDDSDGHYTDASEPDESEDDEKIKQQLMQGQVDEGGEFDTAKLRQYQLERLRYYYAVIECDTMSTAKALYDAMDGREYLSTANFFDLRFIPDSTSFEDDEPHDECSSLSTGYRPNEFRTEALTHSNVRLTWDDDDPTRKEVQKRAFSRAEIDENDLQAYIGTDSSDADSVSSRRSTAAERRQQKKEQQKQEMRAAFGLSAEPSKFSHAEKDLPVGDMQVTFTSGLGGGKSGQSVFLNEPQDEESTRERYIRKERERKQQRKERMKASRNGTQDAEEDNVQRADEAGVPAGAIPEDDPFDDPFFNDPVAAGHAAKTAKKAARRAAKETINAQEKQDRDQRAAELELLMTGDGDAADNVRHFDMREIEKAQKDARRKGKKNKKQMAKDAGESTAPTDDFELQTQDPRFKALFESHEFAIDPTNPRFKRTDGMKALLEEGRKKRKVAFEDDDGAGREDVTDKKPKVDVKQDQELSNLVARLKNKSKRRQ